jgi:hypothetical protein
MKRNRLGIADDSPEAHTSRVRLSLVVGHILLAVLACSLLVLNSVVQADHDHRLTPAGELSSDLPKGWQEDDNDDDIFFDADDAPAWMNEDTLDDKPDVFYDAEEEFDFDEEGAEEYVCDHTESRETCRSCCLEESLNNPFWDQNIGQCLCYGEYYEENICKASQSSDDCDQCCTVKHYSEGVFDDSGRPKSACTCLTADMDYYNKLLLVTKTID